MSGSVSTYASPTALRNASTSDCGVVTHRAYGGAKIKVVPIPPATLRGRLLVATPPLADPNFDGSVVLLLEHGDDGALGIIINRPTDASLATVLPEAGPLLVAAVDRALAFDKNARWQNARAMFEALRAAYDEHRSRPPPLPQARPTNTTASSISIVLSRFS